MIRSFFVVVLLSVSVYNSSSHAQQALRNFVVQENLLKNKQVAVIAADKKDIPDETVNGIFHFSINGFARELEFHDGVAVVKEKIEKSTFIYLRYEGDEEVSRLYFVRVADGDLSPMAVSWLALLLVPGLLILLAVMFRKLIIYAILILAALIYFNSSHGLDLPMFFRTVIDGIGAMF